MYKERILLNQHCHKYLINYKIKHNLNKYLCVNNWVNGINVIFEQLLNLNSDIETQELNA